MKPLMMAGPLMLALSLAACGRDEADETASAPAETEQAAEAEAASEAAPAEPAPAPVSAAPVEADPADAPLTAADLDHYVAGVTREIELLKGHAESLAKARADKNQAAEMAALLALGDVEVRNQGAAAAGIDVARYATIKERIDEVLGAVEMGALVKPQIEAAEAADLSAFTEEQKKQHAEGLEQLRAAWNAPHEKLPPDLVDAFKAREAELAKLRSEALALRLSALQG